MQELLVNRTHWIGPGCARQRNPSRKTGDCRWSSRPAPRDVPSGPGRSRSQPEPEVLRRSAPKGRKTAQGHHHRGCQKAAGRYRERAMQKPPEMGHHGGVIDTVDNTSVEAGLFQRPVKCDHQGCNTCNRHQLIMNPVPKTI